MPDDPEPLLEGLPHDAPGAASAPESLVTDEQQVDAASVDPRRIPQWVFPAIVVFWVGFLFVGVVKNFWMRLDGLILLLVISPPMALALLPATTLKAPGGMPALSPRAASASASL